MLTYQNRKMIETCDVVVSHGDALRSRTEWEADGWEEDRSGFDWSAEGRTLRLRRPGVSLEDMQRMQEAGAILAEAVRKHEEYLDVCEIVPRDDVKWLTAKYAADTTHDDALPYAKAWPTMPGAGNS